MNQIWTILLTTLIIALGIATWWFRDKFLKAKSQISDLEKKLTTATGESIRLKARYGPIVDMDAEVARVGGTLTSAKADLQQFTSDAERKRAELKKSYDNAHRTYESLKREVSLLEENLEDISFGLYKPHFTFQESDEYKRKLEELRDKEREMIRSGQAAVCPHKWQVHGSAKEGERMAQQQMKVLLRAFNGECDAALANVSWNNITKMEERIEKSFEALNKLGTVVGVSITKPYLDLKLDELRLSHELEQKKQEEREEQRRLREQIRDEEKAQKEIEKARKEAEEEEERYEKALQKARAEALAATGAQLEKLTQQISSMEAKLEEAHGNKERALSRAQLTRSGNVYVISNIGSFGERVIKIGMTRRLDPEERIDELGDASVPFPFDIHAMLYSDDAPGLESSLHEFLAGQKVNLVNPRKEFFEGVDLALVEGFAHKRGIKTQFTKLAEAKEYRETLALRAERNNARTPTQAVQGEAFPTDLFAQ